jgi:predicted benzoate:H+ symporter BenE
VSDPPPRLPRRPTDPGPAHATTGTLAALRAPLEYVTEVQAALADLVPALVVAADPRREPDAAWTAALARVVAADPGVRKALLRLSHAMYGAGVKRGQASP